MCHAKMTTVASNFPLKIVELGEVYRHLHERFYSFIGLSLYILQNCFS